MVHDQMGLWSHRIVSPKISKDEYSLAAVNCSVHWGMLLQLENKKRTMLPITINLLSS
jgi:hypothetical protein